MQGNSEFGSDSHNLKMDKKIKEGEEMDKPISMRAFEAFKSKGLSEFNLKQVELIKEYCAYAWEILDTIDSKNDSTKQYLELAKKELELASMWATKALSRNE